MKGSYMKNEELNRKLHMLLSADPPREAVFTCFVRDAKKSGGTYEEIAGTVADMDAYDTVIVGFPIWWGVAPRIIETFLESYDFSGKTIVPFCTSGGSGVGRSDVALHKNVVSHAKWEKGRQINRPTESEIQKWLAEVL